MKPRQLIADMLACPYCESSNVEVKQAGHFVSTLQLICWDCRKASNFKGPEVTFTKELRDQFVRTDFSPEPAF